MRGQVELYAVHQTVSQGDRARWSEPNNQWFLKIENSADGTIFEDQCDVLLSATGILNKWKWPDIPGLSSFKGKLLHSARWDQEYNFEGKTVAVVGAGSSAIQIVPSLQPVVKKLVNFIRSPTWITPEFSESLAKDGRDTRFTPEEIERFNKDKSHFLQYRKLVQNTGSSSFSLYYKGSDLQEQSMTKFANLMRERLDYNEELCEKLIPKFAVGCRRFTPGNGYLESLIKPNVQVVLTGIEEITTNGIRAADRTEHAVDAIVCATGFDCSHRPAFPVVGRNGLDLAEYWKEQPRHYMSVAAPGFPNYFILGGPNSPIANGSLISGLETEISYAFACLRKMQTENIASMDVKEEAVDDFLEHRDSLMDAMVWSGGCRSWYIPSFEISSGEREAYSSQGTRTARSTGL
ncbi:hypothetical protein CLAIMM_02442 isoform 3 [Cladophialophora immunda]|nr:hypothetical protein CLAIMM_02442 isoform 3 [Cladophialophora immunda]